MDDLELLQTLTPNICRAHDVDPNNIEECIKLAKTLEHNLSTKYYEISNVPQDSTPTTYRYLYNILYKQLPLKPCCIGISGCRGAGKTTILLQLFSAYQQKAVYADCTKLRNKTDFNFNTFYTEILNDYKEFVLLDEVNKIPMDLYADFIQCTRSFAAKLHIIVTGSVASLIEHITYDVCRGELYELPPIMYIERLCWEKGCNSIDITTVKRNVTDTSFKEFLRSQLLTYQQLQSYMSGVTNDLYESYHANTYVEDLVHVTKFELEKALKYISLCQLVYKKKDGCYVSTPSIEKDVLTQLTDTPENIKNSWGLSKQVITSTIIILSSCGIIKRLNLRDNVTESLDTLIPAFLFVYPWYATVCLGNTLTQSDKLMDIWIEYALLLRAQLIYGSVYKYRDINANEIDIMYNTPTLSCIEVKNRPLQNLSSSYVNHMKQLRNVVGYKELVLTNSETNCKIAAALELEFIQIQQQGLFNSELQLSQIVKKWFDTTLKILT